MKRPAAKPGLPASDLISKRIDYLADWRGCTGESYKAVVKLAFAKGASLQAPARLFNSSLDGHVRRAIDLREGDAIDASAFKRLVRQAVALDRFAVDVGRGWPGLTRVRE
jgi:hypothetical protein